MGKSALATVLFLWAAFTAAMTQRLCEPNILTYIIGVESNETLQYLNSIMDQIIPKNASTVTPRFNFTHFPIKPRFDSVLNIRAVDAELMRLNIYAIVADYYISVSVAAYSRGIPYFVSGQAEYSRIEYEPHLFQYQVDHNQLNSTLFDLNTALQRKGFVIFTDGSLASSQFAANVIGSVFTQRVMNQNTTDEEIFSTIMSNKKQLGTHSWVLVYGSENLNQIARIFNQSGPAGILTDSEVFIIPSVEEKQQYLKNVRRSSAVIYTFMLENYQRYNNSRLEQMYLKDCMVHFYASINYCKALSNPNVTLISSLQNVSIQGESGNFAYRRGIRYNLTINVMTPEKTRPENDFLLRAGTWAQTSVPAYKAVYFNTNSIRNSLVKFAAVLDKPYIYRDQNGELSGISYDLIKLMSQNLGFQFELIFVPDEAYGSLLSDGNWTGMMKYLIEGNADISANFMTATPERLRHVDLTINLMQSGLIMLVRRTVQRLDFFYVFYPFSWYVWISIVFSVFVLSITLFVSDKISPNESGKSMFTFMESFFLVLSSFLMSKVETEPKKPSSRLFTLLLWFSTLFYMTTYVSNLVPFLVKPDDTLPFDSITNLNTTDYRAIFVNDTLSFQIVRRRWKSLVDQAAVGWPQDMLQQTAANAIKLLQSKDKYVLIDSVTVINYEKSVDCSLIKVGQEEEVQFETMLMSRGFLFKDDIRNYLNSIRYSDYQKLEQKYYGLNRCPNSFIIPSDKTALGFNYFAGFFVAVGIGAVLGFLYIFLHWIYRRVSLWLARRRGTTKLQYGRHYESEVIKITKEGVWVKIEGRQEVFFIANNSLHSDPTRIQNAKSLNLRVGNKMRVQYFGRDSATKNRIFTKLYEKSGWYIEEKRRDEEVDSD